MKERPILFSAPMIRALLAGTKTMTRRIVKLPAAPLHLGEWEATTIGGPGVRDARGREYPAWAAIWHTRTGKTIACPYGATGDRLWVRETWAVPPGSDSPDDVAYRADLTDAQIADERAARRIIGRSPAPWRPGIHMFRWASRISLDITGVRVERLHDISEADAKAEGVERYDDDGVTYYGPLNRGHAVASIAFERLWNEINGAESWNANPFVWVISFSRVETQERAA